MNFSIPVAEYSVFTTDWWFNCLLQPFLYFCHFEAMTSFSAGLLTFLVQQEQPANNMFVVNLKNRIFSIKTII